MRTFNIREIEEGTGGKLIRGSYDASIEGISIDSRTVLPCQLFFPIIGKVNDGHKFLPQVLERGCKSVVISDESQMPQGDVNVVLVQDTTKALQDLAKWYLKQIPATKIVVTGSVGKTSTRDMTYYVCKEAFKTGRNEGNFNSEYGVPMTILGFDPDLEVIVLEVGMDHFGEIDKMVELIEPHIGLITNVGVSHIENLGSRQGILKAKLEVRNQFTEDDLLIVNNDCDLLTKENARGDYRLQMVGAGEGCQAQVKEIKDLGDEGIEYKLGVNGEDYNIRLYVPGAHNATNSALAILAGLELGMTVEQSIKGLEGIQLTGKRLNIRQAKSVRVIDDTYNACPDSMKSAINTLAATKAKRRIAILGDMYELGNNSREFHREVGKYASNKDIDLLIAVGDLAESIAKGAKEKETTVSVKYFANKEELYKELPGIIREGDLILVKGSRGMTMETIVENILKINE